MTSAARFFRPALVGSCVVACATTVCAQSFSPFTELTFADRKQFTVTCAARYECDIELESGERVNDGFNAHIDDWDPHVGYSGDAQRTPHLVLRPARAGLRTNIILTTTKRTYYILAVSTATQQPSYYSFSYADETYKSLANLSIATQTALRAAGQLPMPEPSPTPANVASLASTCFDYDYSYLVDPEVQSDHIPGARASRERFPGSLVPTVVCTDGQHTYVQFPIPREVPADLPVTFSVGSEGDNLINYTYLSAENRFTVDGVYDSFAMELGSQRSPVRLRIFHAGRGVPDGRHAPRPTQIVPPAAYVAAARANVTAPATETPTDVPVAPVSVSPQPTAVPPAAPTSEPAIGPTPTPSSTPDPGGAPGIGASATPEPARAATSHVSAAVAANDATAFVVDVSPAPDASKAGSPLDDFDAFLVALPRPQPTFDAPAGASRRRLETVYEPESEYDATASGVRRRARMIAGAAFWRSRPRAVVSDTAPSDPLSEPVQAPAIEGVR